MEILTGHKLEQISPDSVELSRMDGSRVKRTTQAVVLAMGVSPRKDVVEQFERAFDRVVVVGDANREGRIIEAVSDGFTKAWVFDP